jgi:hypothetical protein
MEASTSLVLQRSYTPELLNWVKTHPMFIAMCDGIDSGEILPALRKQEVHFYEAGARLLRFSGALRKVFTHARYIDAEGKRERYLTDCELNAATLALLRKTAKNHREGKGSELAEVHKLFGDFSVTRRTHRPHELALVDVEARFARGDDLTARMIDLVFLLPDLRLLFIEAKCVGNSAIRSTGVADVARHQIPDYERHIKREGVLIALNRTLQAQSALTGRDLGQANAIIRCVPLLVLDPQHGGLSPRSSDSWLRERLEVARMRNWSFAEGDVALINGMHNPSAAIREFVGRLPAWA